MRNVMKRTADVGKEFSNFVHELDGVNSVSLEHAPFTISQINILETLRFLRLGVG